MEEQGRNSPGEEGPIVTAPQKVLLVVVVPEFEIKTDLRVVLLGEIFQVSL